MKQFPKLLRSTRVGLNLLLIFLLSDCFAKGSETSFWVWQRTAPLTSDEAAALARAQVHDLYWQAGTLVPKNQSWAWQERFAMTRQTVAGKAPGIHFIPVVRLEPPSSWAFSEENGKQLSNLLDNLAESWNSDEIQIDYEAPDRMIGSYVGFLKNLKQHRTWRLSISALGHWAGFTQKFQPFVDEITPMFYDLNPRREAFESGSLPELTTTNLTETQMKGWKSCAIQWKAGLPNFSRLTVLNSAGVSRGNIRTWDWNEIWFSSLLEATVPTTLGQTTFHVSKSGVLADTPVFSGESVVARYPDLGSLMDLTMTAREDGGKGIIFFRLPDQKDMSAYFPTDLIGTRSPNAITAKWTTPSRLSLTGSHSLMPTVSSSKLRGYAFEVETSGDGWREAIPGDFSKVTTDPMGQLPVTDTLGLGVKALYFWFSHLPAGESLETGLLQQGSPETVRWRILNFDLDSSWHALK